MEEVNNKKNKTAIIIIVILIIIILGLVAYLFKDKFLSNNDIKSENKIVKNPATVYKATVDAYGEAITYAVKEYMTKNSGSIPTWEDIEKDIPPLSKKISCDNYINYDGSVYLENCTVEDLNYKGKYTYGKKLPEPIKSNKEIYIYGFKYSDNSYGYNITDFKYDSSINYDKEIVYNCIKDTCRGYAINERTKQALIYDENVYYLYDFINKKKEKIDLGSVIYNNMGFLASKNDTYGIYVWNDSSKGAIYNVKTKKYITDFVYDGINNYNIDELLDSNYFAAYKMINNELTLYIISSDGSIRKTFPAASAITSMKVSDKPLYAITNHMSINTAKLYNDKFEPLIDNTNYYGYAVNSDNTITITETKERNNKFMIYNYQGEKIYDSKEYKSIVKVVKDYIAILDNENNLKLIDLKENEVANFLKITNNYTVHSMISGWHTENGKNGIYIVVENKNIPYGTEGAGLEYYYIPSTKESGVIKTVGVGGYAKPVLYLYPTKKTKVNVSFENSELLTTTYPKYKNNWQVYAYPNGDLYDMNNKYYYGLYWEELGSSYIDFSEGFYVNKENAITFLDNITEKIGFTRREANEFIMYWLPILEKNEHNLVYFEFTESRDKYNKIKIIPKPDSLLRVAIHVKKVSGKVTIKEENIPSFNRHGFTAVEWGGVIH